ncbi:hypothetical protein, partial [Candidatus Liberibacter solanacearum]|uniref:hypothetical protein n=1 Tax=Candidatus Liberibacter solanacearum TaxID=556287 RepID=UPI0005525A20
MLHLCNRSLQKLGLPSIRVWKGSPSLPRSLSRHLAGSIEMPPPKFIPLAPLFGLRATAEGGDKTVVMFRRGNII